MIGRSDHQSPQELINNPSLRPASPYSGRSSSCVVMFNITWAIYLRRLLRSSLSGELKVKAAREQNIIGWFVIKPCSSRSLLGEDTAAVSRCLKHHLSDDRAMMDPPVPTSCSSGSPSWVRHTCLADFIKPLLFFCLFIVKGRILCLRGGETHSRAPPSLCEKTPHLLRSEVFFQRMDLDLLHSIHCQLPQ